MSYVKPKKTFLYRLCLSSVLVTTLCACVCDGKTSYPIMTAKYLLYLLRLYRSSRHVKFQSVMAHDALMRMSAQNNEDSRPGIEPTELGYSKIERQLELGKDRSLELDSTCNARSTSIIWISKEIDNCFHYKLWWYAKCVALPSEKNPLFIFLLFRCSCERFLSG